MNKFKSEKGVSLIALIIFLVMIILAAGIIVVMVRSADKGNETNTTNTTNTTVNTVNSNEVSGDTTNALENEVAATTISNEDVDYVVLKVEDTTKGELAYKEQKITDKEVINSLMEVVTQATAYENKSFIPDFGDAPEEMVIYYTNGTTVSLMAGDEIEDAGNKVNLIATWQGEDDGNKSLLQVNSKLSEAIQKAFSEAK